MFGQRFEKQVLKFIQDNGLFHSNEPLYLAVSGGVDSMVLLFFLHRLKSYGYSCELNIVHINHGTRQDQIDEEKLVKNFCLKLRVNFLSFKLKDLDTSANFEANARIKRYEIFDRASNSAKVLLAHHIDDSFEWYLLQSFRSGRLRSTLGIPALNGKYIRPFMSVTKAQILRYAQVNQVPFLDDPTNNDINFERNYIRNTLVPLIAKRHPRYLYHYVQRSNLLAQNLNKSLTKVVSDSKITRTSNSSLIYSFKNNNYLSSGVALEEIIRLSHKKRGNLTQQIEKLLLAVKNFKKGPLLFSGNVKVYIDDQMILIRNQEFSSKSFVLEKFEKMTFSEFEKLSHAIINDQRLIDSFPFWIVLHDPLKIEKRAFTSSFNPVLLGELKSFHYFPMMKFLKLWHKPALRSKKITLSIVKVNVNT